MRPERHVDLARMKGLEDKEVRRVKKLLAEEAKPPKGEGKDFLAERKKILELTKRKPVKAELDAAREKALAKKKQKKQMADEESAWEQKMSASFSSIPAETRSATGIIRELHKKDETGDLIARRKKLLEENKGKGVVEALERKRKTALRERLEKDVEGIRTRETVRSMDQSRQELFAQIPKETKSASELISELTGQKQKRFRKALETLPSRAAKHKKEKKFIEDLNQERPLRGAVEDEYAEYKITTQPEEVTLESDEDFAKQGVVMKEENDVISSSPRPVDMPSDVMSSAPRPSYFTHKEVKTILESGGQNLSTKVGAGDRLKRSDIDLIEQNLLKDREKQQRQQPLTGARRDDEMLAGDLNLPEEAEEKGIEIVRKLAKEKERPETQAVASGKPEKKELGGSATIEFNERDEQWFVQGEEGVGPEFEKMQGKEVSRHLNALVLEMKRLGFDPNNPSLRRFDFLTNTGRRIRQLYKTYTKLSENPNIQAWLESDELRQNQLRETAGAAEEIRKKLNAVTDQMKAFGYHPTENEKPSLFAFTKKAKALNDLKQQYAALTNELKERMKDMEEQRRYEAAHKSRKLEEYNKAKAERALGLMARR